MTHHPKSQQERDDFDEDGARASSLIPAHKQSVLDPLYDLQLLRDVKIINERTGRELGPLPAGGLLVRTKHKPKVWSPNPHHVMTNSPNSATESEENERVKVSHTAAALVLAAATTLTACRGDGHASSAPDTNKPASAESVTSAPGERNGPITAASSILMKTMAYRELARVLSLDCEDADKGRGCTMSSANTEDRFTVTPHPGCGKEGIFVVVSDHRVPEVRVLNNEDWDERGAELWEEGLITSKAEVRATLSKGQVVCIQATAYIENEINPSYYYVTAVPVEMFEDCRTTAACEKYADPPITWHVPHPGPACRATGPWSYEGICAAGWIRADYISGYFNHESSTNDVQKESGK
jgi:hypothetical protein